MRFTPLAGGLLVVALLGVPALARSPDGAQLLEKKEALSQTRQQLEMEKAKAAHAKRREASLLTRLEAIDQALASKKRELRRLDRRFRKAESGVSGLRREISLSEQRQTGRQKALAHWLRALYKLEAQGGVIPLVLGGEDPVARAVQLRHLATLAAVDARLVEEYRRVGTILANRRDRIERRKQELSALRTQVRKERAKVDRTAARRRRLLAKVRDQRAYHERLVSELSEAARELKTLVQKLQASQERLAKLRTAPGADGGFGRFRGKLPWPTTGSIVTAFGPRVHPRFGTKTFRNGIDIKAREGTEILAVYAGRVIYTGWFKGYGNLIILDHGNEYYTLYAHAAEIRVREGDTVPQGQAIGTVGETGSVAGPRLYFEVRHRGRPQDPAAWLEREANGTHAVRRRLP
ncbi:MAG: murein hydrolase activator EnvC family protein [Candidatus Methylomirabilia bacterium]